MPIFQSEKGLVFYAHIPKCGGMSIEQKLSFLPTHLKTPFLHGERQQRFPCSPQHFHSEIITRLFDVDALHYSFTVTRHPYNRLISEYKFRSDIAKRQSREMPDINNWIENTFKNYAENNFILDNHIRPQGEFLIPGMDVMKLEDGMDAIFARISEALGIDKMPVAAHANKSTEMNLTVSRDSKDLVRDFYKSDLEYFNYSPDF